MLLFRRAEDTFLEVMVVLVVVVVVEEEEEEEEDVLRFNLCEAVVVAGLTIIRGFGFFFFFFFLITFLTFSVVEEADVFVLVLVVVALVPSSPASLWMRRPRCQRLLEICRELLRCGG